MTAPHTQGPLAVFADERSILVSTQDGDVRIARLFSADGCDLGNAHLFAGASNMLAALKALDSDARPDNWEDEDGPGEPGHDAAAAWRLLDAAIALAEGRGA